MKIELAKWKMEFAKDIAYHANNKKIADNLRNVFPYPYTFEDAEEYINSCMENDEKKQCCRAIVVDGKAVGSVGIFVKDDVYCKNGEIGYWLSEEYWHKGIMTFAVTEMCKYAFDHYDIVRIFAEPYAHNTGSRKTLEKCGFTLEGILKNSVYKNGQIYDSCMYGLLDKEVPRNA